MAIDTAAPRSRRALLAAAAGGLAALAANALGRPLQTRAADGQTVLVGAGRTGTLTTSITNSTNGNVVFSAVSTGGGIALSGNSTSSFGVQGVSTSSIGVDGQSDTWYGVRGVSGLKSGVYGFSEAPDEAATVGHNNGESTGVFGFSGIPFGTLPAAPAKTGVYGRATQDGGARGVHGYSTAGRGVYGQATSGHGVHGFASGGYAGYFAAGATGKALRAQGPVEFSTSGLATIASGTALSGWIDPGADLTAGSKILCTLQGNAGGATTVERVQVDTAADQFRIYLTAAATADVKVAWFVIG